MTDKEAVRSTGNVLDLMTTKTVERKAGKVMASLTPVGIEQVLTHVPVDGAPFAGLVTKYQLPHDGPMGTDGMLSGAVRVAREQLAYMDECLFAVEASFIGEEQARENAGSFWANRKLPTKVDAEATQKGKEAVADLKAVKAAAIIETLKGEEQKAATFTMAPLASADGWSCPDHGQAVTKTSKKGRVYRECPVDECPQFER